MDFYKILQIDRFKTTRKSNRILQPCNKTVKKHLIDGTLK